MQLTGRILSVDTRNLSETTRTDKTAGATTLDVTDASTFSLTGGAMLLDGVALNYISADYDADTITLEVPLTSAVLTDAVVEVVPASPVRTALVDLGGNGEATPVQVPQSLATLIEDGIRSPLEQETVYVERREDGSLVLLDVIGQPAVLTLEALAAAQTSDGVPPTSSPTPTVIGGIGALSARWTPLTNADPVTYAVHLSTDSAFVPGTGTLITETQGFSATLRTLPNGTPMVYDTTYFVRIVARDEDGTAPASSAQGAQLMRVTGPDIAASYVYAGSITAAQITGGTISSDVLLSGSIKTAPSGARVELGAFGLIEYDSAGNPAVLLGTDGQASFRGQVQATTLTVTGGMSLRGTANEISRSASLTLAVGSTASSNAPSVVVDYDSTALQEGAGAGGTFLSLTPYSLERVGSQWLVTYSDGLSRLFSSTGAFVGTVGSADLTKRATTQLAANAPVYFVNTSGRLCRDLHLVNGVEQRQLDDPLDTLTAWTTSGATLPVINAGRAQFSVAPGIGAAGLVSVASYAMQGHDVSADLGSVGVLHPTQTFYLRMRIDANNYAQLEQVTDTGTPQLRIRVVKAGVATVGAANVYSPTGQANVTLREDGGLFYIATRPDASSALSYQNSLGHTFTKAQLASCKIELGVIDTGPANVIANGSFETDAAGWTGTSTANSTLTRSTAQAHTGTGSLLVKSVAAGDTGATSSSASDPTNLAVPVTTGATYTLGWWGRTVAATPRQMALRFYWYDSAGNYISANSADGSFVDNTAWAYHSASAVAPYGAAYVGWRVYMRGLNAAESYYADDVVMTYNPLSAFADNVRVRWVDAIGLGFSVPAGSAIDNDGTKVLIASPASDGTVVVRTVDPDDLVTVTSTTTLATVAGMAGSTLTGLEVGTFDFGGTRTVVKAAGSAAFAVYNGTAPVPTETFPAAPGGSAGFDWDGSAFIELSSNSRLYKHTSVAWLGAATVPWDAAFTWYDGNATGGTHETTPSPRQTFTMSKRARLTITSPDIPNLGGTDDPDRIGVYLANVPSSGTLYQQLVTAAGVKTAVLSSAIFSGTAAPVTNNFPGATPGTIVSSDGALAIKGDGSVQATTVRATAMHIGRVSKNTAQAYVASTSAVVQLNTVVQLVGMTWDAVNYKFTITKAGRYLIAASVCYAATPPAAGRIECTVWINGTPTALRTVGAPVVTSSFPCAGLDIVRDLVVGDTVQLVSFETCGAYSTHTNATATFLEVAALY